MKKMFLATLTALALCSYSYAQDDEYEDEAPSRVEKAPSVVEDEDEAPVVKKAESKKAVKNTASSENPFFGIGLDVTGLMSRNYAINFSFMLNPDMMLTAIFGFQHQGETTVSSGGTDTKMQDNTTTLAVGAAFDYFVARKFIPFSIGGEFVFNSLPDDVVMGMFTESNARLDFGVMAGIHGAITPNLILSGKLGFEFNYYFGDINDVDDLGDPITGDYGHMDFGLAYKINLTWFAF
ncbi:hypothetical protein SAMN06298224_1914 [Fibrobacter sp. UWB16]|uniref:hypothetical protein n=1 Tax=unclassified Fibrobacter TaxID=2634177 RepID=UPI000B51E975|nr:MULTISPECIES: hypothetical protein [unclassified Fibrobacter]OWV22170.1 hypothetical protein B7991_04225 [Fibrobacter sp. UWB3]SOD14600.1 hypothetical protein SAMN06298224_1914 [Fibrobacter sp. UWB16]